MDVGIQIEGKTTFCCHKKWFILCNTHTDKNYIPNFDG